MANDWTEARFGNLVRFVSDKSQAKDASIDTYISTENMVVDFGGVLPASTLPLTGSVTKFKVGDTLFSNIRTYFKKVWQARFDGCCSNDVLVLRPANEGALIPNYLHQICRWEKFTKLSIRTSKGAKMPRGDKDALADFKFRLPPIDEQRAIAHILGTLDDKIELNRKQNEMLEAMARALFKAWFVDFEPVRAKMEGRWQRGQSLPGLPAHLYDIFPDRLVESELGEIPEGWRHSTIGEEVTVCGGSTPSTKEPEFWEGGQHCWATPKDLSALKFPVLLDTDRKITDAGLAKISSGLLPVGTVLLSSRAPIGYLAIAEVPTAINQGFIAMKCDGVLPNVFVLQWCRESMDAIVGNANGSTFQEISKSNFRPLRVVVPSDPVLTSFTRSAGSLYRQLAENEREARTLAQLRDTLLPKLISGELRVSEIEETMAEAMTQ
jgi:type I restriction enzyme S subunit